MILYITKRFSWNNSFGRIPYRTIFLDDPNIRFLQGRVKHITADVVILETETISFTNLVLCPGAIRADWLPDLLPHCDGSLAVGGLTGALIPRHFLVISPSTMICFEKPWMVMILSLIGQHEL